MFSGIEASIARLRFFPRVSSLTQRPRIYSRIRSRRRSSVQSIRGPSYEDIARRHARENSREDRPLKPLPIQLAETIEGICLLAAVTLKLIPVCYSVYLQRHQWQQQQQTSASEATEAVTSEQAVTIETRSVEDGQTEMPAPSSLSHLSTWSGVALLMAVIIGSGLRRFQLPSSDASVLMEWSVGEREEMEGSLSRAFAEIAHMASQIENLRTKVRSMRREYTHAFENADVQSDRWRRKVDEMAAAIQGAESRISEFNEIMEAMQGFASKQFVVVSSALRRIDKECKTLGAQLQSMATASPHERSTSPNVQTVSPTEEEAEIDFQS